ncbi:hypothetical protein O7626_41135 [Micromonospora sp. WMMD1102]|uniref:hypothetical protein n=1 Tax=Micromonospora sp. WMMD1102 TaxID=3016105 RepID=UPI0024152042|nr:hypothetical protein [Micromonospora sp. WMMD1102]MDG4784367.1 hypothetical protein [Micromonospora sp. WMMD1102]MDG4784441.1 hypothetical protein [Micromonospora sp. WMMD1102]MDG4792210.1 hypothetical protein [Micromonospora sp. WMMD1102]
MGTTYVPASASADAKNRAFRTFWQGLLVDVGAVLAAVLVVALGDIQWTETYWIGVASLVGKTVITAVVSYVARKTVPPAP